MTLSVAYFNKVYAAFQEAGQKTGTLERFYAIGPRTIKLVFAEKALIPHITPALEHLSVDHTGNPALTVCLWDSATTDKEIPPFPWSHNDNSCADNIPEGNVDVNPVIFFKDEYVLGAYEIGTRSLSMLDTYRNLAVYWTPDVDDISYFVQGAPIRTILQWWARSQSLQLIHGGAVGTGKGGVIIVGKGGSGKTNTALACIRSGLLYASDDYFMLDPESHFCIYSIYNSCKLDYSGLMRFPELSPESHNFNNTHKIILFLNRYFPDKMIPHFPVRAIVLPKVVGYGDTRLKKVSPAAALRAMAPSTIFQLRGSGRHDLKTMAELVRQVPGYTLELGKNIQEIPDAILSLL